MGSSYVCMGDSPAGPKAAGNICTCTFFDGGFITVDLTGRYVYLFRDRSSIAGAIYNIAEIKLYGMPNLVESATVISSYSPINPDYSSNNLVTNFSTRSAHWNLPPLINATGTAASFKSCFRVSTSSHTGPYIFGLDQG